MDSTSVASVVQARCARCGGDESRGEFSPVRAQVEWIEL